MPKALSVYDKYASLLKAASKHEQASTHHVMAGYAKDDWMQTPEGKKHQVAYDEHRKQFHLNSEAADKLKYDHLRPFEEATDKLIDRAYLDRIGITAFKRARLALWKEQDKFEAAIDKSLGRKPLKRVHNPNRDFE